MRRVLQFVGSHPLTCLALLGALWLGVEHILLTVLDLPFNYDDGGVGGLVFLAGAVTRFVLLGPGFLLAVWMELRPDSLLEALFMIASTLSLTIGIEAAFKFLRKRAGRPQ